MSTHCSCHCLVITSLVTKSPVAVKVKVGHTQKRSTMANKSSEGELLKKKSVDHNRKRIENISRVNAVKEKMIHSDQPEFFYQSSPLLRTFNLDVLAPNVAAHSYYDSVFLKIFTALSFLANLRLLSFANCRLEDFFI